MPLEEVELVNGVWRITGELLDLKERLKHRSDFPPISLSDGIIHWLSQRAENEIAHGCIVTDIRHWGIRSELHLITLISNLDASPFCIIRHNPNNGINDQLIKGKEAAAQARSAGLSSATIVTSGLFTDDMCYAVDWLANQRNESIVLDASKGNRIVRSAIRVMHNAKHRGKVVGLVLPIDENSRKRRILLPSGVFVMSAPENCWADQAHRDRLVSLVKYLKQLKDIADKTNLFCKQLGSDDPLSKYPTRVLREIYAHRFDPETESSQQPELPIPVGIHKEGERVFAALYYGGIDGDLSNNDHVLRINLLPISLTGDVNKKFVTSGIESADGPVIRFGCDGHLGKRSIEPSSETMYSLLKSIKPLLSAPRVIMIYGNSAVMRSVHEIIWNICEDRRPPIICLPLAAKATSPPQYRRGLWGGGSSRKPVH